MKALNHNHTVRHLVFTLLLGMSLVFSNALATDAISDTASFFRWHQPTFGSASFQEDVTADLLETSDGSYIAVGVTYQSENHGVRVRSNITKFQKNGAILWNKAFGVTDGLRNFSFNKVIELNNGDLLALGVTNEDVGVAAAGAHSMFIVRFDSLGNIKWQKAYGRMRTENPITSLEALTATENSDGNLSILGRYANSFNYTDEGSPVFIELNLDASGNLLSHEMISDGNDSHAGRLFIQKTADTGYLIGANYWVSDLGWTGVVTKLDASGNKEWGHYLAPKDSNGNSVAIGDTTATELDDGYLFIEVTNIDKVNKLFVYKVNFEGEVLWHKLISNLTLNNYISASNASWNLHHSQAGSVLISVTNGFSNIDFTVININPSNGEVAWVKSYGDKASFDREDGGSKAFRILHTTDNHIVGAGRNFLTKILGNGDVPFTTEEFMTQARVDYVVQVPTVQKTNAGFWEKFVPEFSITEKSVDYFLSGAAIDLSVVSDTPDEPIIPEDPISLVSPSDFSFTLEADILTLQWGAIEGATGYQLLLGTSSGDYASPLDLGNVTQFGPFDASSAPRGSYYLAIEAYNASDTAAPSNEIMLTLRDQMTPENLVFTLSEENLTLNWDSVANASGYTLYFGNASGEYVAHLDLGNALQIGPADMADTPRGTYYLAVTAYNANRESDFSNEIIVTLKSATASPDRSVSSYIDIVTGLSNDVLNGGLTDQLQPVLMALLGQPSSDCPMVDMNFDLSSAESLDGLLQSLPKPSIINIDYGSGCTTDTGELMAGQTSLTVDDLAIDANTGNISAIFSMEVNNLSKDSAIIGNGTLSGNLVANMENSSASGHIGMSNFLIPNGLQLSGGIDLQTLENKDLLLDMSITSDSNINAQLKLLVTANEDDSYTLNTQAPGTIDQYTVTIDSLLFNSELCEAYPIAGEVLFSTSEQTQTVRFDDRCDGTYILE